MARIDAFLKLGTDQGCSDIHFAVGLPPMLRMHGDLMPIKFRDLSQAELEGYIAEIVSKPQPGPPAQGPRRRLLVRVRRTAGASASTCFARTPASAPRSARFPPTCRRSTGSALPPIVKKLCDYHQGMILVTGSTGTGKSTTLAAMIDHLNATRRVNIVSLEDPIEFVHKSKQSQIIQRELNTHLPSFAEGVRAAMREDPDVILVGELRDADTIRWAMTAAETGHLVLGTLHTTGAVKTIDRVVDALPADEREQTKSFLSQSLIAVITQVLVKTADQRGRKADLRSHGADARDRQADHDRPDAPDSDAAADRQGPRHADARPGAARERAGEGNRSRRRLRVRERQAPVLASS